MKKKRWTSGSATPNKDFFAMGRRARTIGELAKKVGEGPVIAVVTELTNKKHQRYPDRNMVKGVYAFRNGKARILSVGPITATLLSKEIEKLPDATWLVAAGALPGRGFFKVTP